MKDSIKVKKYHAITFAATAISASLSLFAESYTINKVDHPITQFGRISYGTRSGMGNSTWKNIPLSQYAFMGEGDIANLNNNETTWQENNLSCSQLRFDGYFQVSADKAGTWNINQKFDDYFSFFIDGKEIVSNNGYKNEANATTEMTEGWHSFTIIAGDTYGGYGSNKDYGGEIGRVPFTITVNGNTYAFNDTNFPQGRDNGTVQLTADTDWSTYESITLENGVILDLAGHKLKARKIICNERAAICGGSGSEIHFTVDEDNYNYLGESYYLSENIMLSADIKVILTKDNDVAVSSSTLGIGDKPKAQIEFVQNDGTLNLSVARHFMGGAANGNMGHGIYKMNGGTISTSDDSEFIIGNYGHGELIQTGGEINIGNWISIARETNGTGIYTMTGGKLTATTIGRQLWIAGQDGSKGIWNIGGDAQAHLNGIYLGGDLGGDRIKNAEVNISGNAKIIVDANFRAETKNSTKGATHFKVTQSGGELSIGGDLNLPSFNGNGSFIQTGGKTTVGNTVFFGCGNSKSVNNPSTGTLEVGGEFTAGGNGVSLGQHTGGTGTLYLRDGGILTTPSIYRNAGESDTKGYTIFNGGTIKSTKDGNILNNLTDVKFGSGEVVFDTSSYNVAFNNSPISRVSPFGTIAKDGEGTLTVKDIKTIGKVSVRKGSLNFASGNNITSPSGLAHRWSFKGDLKDSITGEEGEIIGSKASEAKNEDGVIKLPGGSKGSCYIELGANKLSGNNVTIEMWITLRELRNWVRGFVFCTQDLKNIVAFCIRRKDTDGNVCSFQCCNSSQFTDKVLELNKTYYVALVFEDNGAGGVIIRQYLKEANAEGFLWTNTFTKDNWSVSQNAGQDYMWLGHSDGNDYDTKADYDEMRIWSSALTTEEIAKSASLGPNASLDFGELEIKSGATLDLGGNTLTTTTLSAYGTLKNGNVIISKLVNANANESLTVSSGATLDITKADISFTDSEDIARSGLVIATSLTDGIIPAEPRKIGGGYWLYLTSNKARILRQGFIFTIK